MSTDLGNREGGSGGGEEQSAAVAAGSATEATSLGAAVKDFLTTPQVQKPVCLLAQRRRAA